MLRTLSAALVVVAILAAGCLSGPGDPVGPPDANRTNATANGTPDANATTRPPDRAPPPPKEPTNDPPKVEPWPRKGSEVSYAMRFGQSLPGGDSGVYYAKVVWANATFTYDGRAWAGTCRSETQEFRDGENPAWTTSSEETQLSIPPLRESTTVQKGDSIEVEFLRGCEVHTTELFVEGKETRDGREVWVARSPANETEFHEETATWDAMSGLTAGWSLLRRMSSDRGNATVT